MSTLSGNKFKLGYIKGALYGDGCYFNLSRAGRNGNYFTHRVAQIQANDSEMVETVADFARELFCVKAAIVGPRKPNAAYKRLHWSWRTQNKSLVLIENQIPESRREWRGFIAGLFDAEGSHCNGTILIRFKKTKENIFILENIARELHVRNFFSRVVNSEARSWTTLTLRVFRNGSKEMNRLTNLNRHIQARKMIHRFFKTFLPRIRRKWPVGLDYAKYITN